MRRHRGKLLGAALGFSFGGPIGAVVGGAVGALFDSSEFAVGPGEGGPGEGARTSGWGGVGARSDAERELVFITSLVLLLIGAARSDGPVTEQELGTIKKFFKGLGYGQREYYLIERIINASRTRQINLRAACADISSRTSYEERLFLVKLGYEVALSDGSITSVEEGYIRQASKYLGILEYDFTMIRSSFTAREFSAGEMSGGPSYKDPYNVLAVSPDCSDEEVHRAYRILAGKYHPDKVSHLGAEFIDLANRKFSLIQSAYSTIKKERGIS